MNATMKCPKCPGYMRTYNRAGVNIEQCDNCRGIFLDYGELEAVGRAENQWAAAPPAAPPASYVAPAWAHGAHGYQQHGYHHKKSFSHYLFSS